MYTHINIIYMLYVLDIYINRCFMTLTAGGEGVVAFFSCKHIYIHSFIHTHSCINVKFVLAAEQA